MRMLLKTLLLPTLLLAVSVPAEAGKKAVKLHVKDKTVRVTIDGDEFAVYNVSHKLPKPFFHPVRGPGGPVLTRPIGRSGDDHHHHKGIWVAVDKVNGIAFWAEDSPIRNVSVEPLSKQGSPAKLKVVNHWLGEDGEPILVENTTISIFPDRLLAYDITFKPADGKVTFGDTKEGMFGFRMVNSMREEEGGHVVNADGLEGASACWGKTAAWVDYYGEVQGDTCGVAIFDHPDNFRPSRYHVRGYGLFSISPFGERAYTKGKQDAKPVTLQPDEKLRLRYAMYIHAGDTDEADVEATYRNWLKRTQ